MAMFSRLAKLTPTAFGQRAFDATMASAKVSGRGVGSATAKATANAEKAMKAAKMSYAAGAIGLVGTSTAMRPNANQSRTSYRGPMQTGRGSGRYA